MYSFRRFQNIPISIGEAWTFMSDPVNLASITPEDMKFRIISGADRSIYAGQIIEYKVSPFPGLAVKWVTEITHVQNLRFFVDEQRFGPYSFWHHKHFLKEIPGGVEMEDVIHYKLPFGILGRFANALFVEKKLEAIFEYRRNKLTELFGKSESTMK